MKALKIFGIIGILAFFSFVFLYFSSKNGSITSPQSGPAEYAEVHRLDPIFSFPGVTISNLEQEVSAFKISARVAIPSYPAGEKAESFEVFPFHFLDAIPKAEAARRAMLASPTESTVSAYHTALIVLIANYQKDLRQVSMGIDNATTSSSDRYFFFAGDTTPSYVQNVLSDADTKAAALTQKENRRFSCFSGQTVECESVQKIRQAFGSTEDTSEVDSPVTLPGDVRRNLTILKNVNPDLDTNAVVSLKRSACYSDTPTYYALSTKKSRLSSLNAVKIYFLNDLYVYDLAHTKNKPFFDAIRLAGSQYSYQPFNAYLCPDAGEDMGKVSTMIYVRTELSSHPFLFANDYLPPTFVKLKKTQTKFLQEKVLDSGTYDTFIEAASSVIRENSDADISRYNTDLNASQRLVELVTLARSRSANFEERIGYFDDLQVGSFLLYHFNSLPVSALIITRGGISPLFAFENRTGIFSEPQSLLERKKQYENPYATMDISLRSYTANLRAEISENDLTQILLQDIISQNIAFGNLIQTLQKTMRSYK